METKSEPVGVDVGCVGVGADDGDDEVDDGC